MQGNKIKTKIKILIGIVISLTAFAVIVKTDSIVRSHYGGQMNIVGLPLKNANVVGTWKPEFLWAGKAWTITIESGVNLELKLDDSVYVIPKGSHRIYSNHDNTNTGEFGSQPFWGYPEKIEIRLFEGEK